MKQLGFFIALSLVFHFLVTTSSLYFAEHLLGGEKRPQTTEVEVIESDNKTNEELEKTRQLIKQLKTTVQKYIDQKKAARFESEETQRVEKETKAANFGLTQNSFPAKAQQNQSAATAEENQARPKTADGDLPEFARFRSGPSQVAVSQQSAIANNLPSDIQNSNATNLNTDANTYYSFYSRVEELFYVRWVERANFHWARIPFDFKKNTLAGKTWSTEIEVWLKANGEFHSAILRKSCGFQPFDEAAVFAFKDTKLFPNPPKAKIEADGFVRLRYRFNIMVGNY